MSLKNKKLWILFLNYLKNSNEGYTFKFNDYKEKTDLIKIIKRYLNEPTENIYEELPDNIFNLLLKRIDISCKKVKNSLYSEILVNNMHTKISGDKNVIICSKESFMKLEFIKSLTSYKQNLIINSLKENNLKLTNQYIKKYVPGGKIYAVFDIADINILSQKNIIKENNKKVDFYEYCE